MSAPEKAAVTKAAAPLVQISPAIAMQAKALSIDRAFQSFGVCAACGGVQGLHTWAAQPPLAKNGQNGDGRRDLSLEYCSCEGGDELYPD